MSDFKGFAILKTGESLPVVSGLRLSQALKKCEEMNKFGVGKYYIQEDWNGRPTSVITRTKPYE